jgi:Type IV secretion system pilin
LAANDSDSVCSYSIAPFDAKVWEVTGFMFLPHPPLVLGAACSSGSGVSGTNPLVTFLTDVQSILQAVGIAAITVMVIYTGYLVLTSAGSPEGMERAKRAIFGIVVGGFVIFAASSITTFIQGNVC